MTERVEDMQISENLLDNELASCNVIGSDHTFQSGLLIAIVLKAGRWVHVNRELDVMRTCRKQITLWPQHS